MKDQNKISVKLSQEGLDFLDKINTNRIRAGITERQLCRADILDDIIQRYFKLKNDRYIEMIKITGEKDEKSI